MQNYHFKFHVGQEHLSELALKYAPDFYIDISYSAKFGNVEIYYYAAGDVAHRNILWTAKLYKQIHEAAMNNYQSQFEAHESYCYF